MLGIVVVLSILFINSKTSYEFRLDTNEPRVPSNMPTSTMVTLGKLPFPLIPTIVEIKSNTPSIKANPLFEVSLNIHVNDITLEKAQAWLDGITVKSVQVGSLKNDASFVFPKLQMHKGSMALHTSQYVAFPEVSLDKLKNSMVDGKLDIRVMIEDNGVEKMLEYKMLLDKSKSLKIENKGAMFPVRNPDPNGAWNESARLTYE